jgi:acyl-CoA thioesterase FadM
MARIKIELPQKLSFTTTIPVRITDLNYGGHVGNDAILSLLHEARVQFLKNVGFQELNCAGVGLIMSDVAIEFKREIFYGDQLIASVGTGDFTRAGFDIFYRLDIANTSEMQVAVIAKTGMVCYDYTLKKITAVPASVKEKLSD